MRFLSLLGQQLLNGSALSGPVLDLNFLTGTMPSGITFTRASAATYFDATGTLQSAASNAPRFDYGPTPGTTPLGLLIEEQRTNSIRNPRCEGAAAGSPGTPPTNWTIDAAAGVSPVIIGTGYEAGIPYIDIQYSGTPSASGANNIYAENAISAAASSGWTHAVCLRLLAGSWANVALTVGMLDNNSTQYNSATVTPTAAGLASQRYVWTATLGASSSTVRPRLRIGMTSGLAVNFTVRIGAPQLELGVAATSVILPPAGSPAATTRAADKANAQSASLIPSAPGSFAAEFYPMAWPNNGVASVMTACDGTSANRAEFAIDTRSGNGFWAKTVNASGNASVNYTSPSIGAVHKAALSYTGALLSGALDAAVGSVASVYVPSSYVGGIFIGCEAGYGSLLNGYVRRIRYWQRALFRL